VLHRLLATLSLASMTFALGCVFLVNPGWIAGKYPARFYYLGPYLFYDTNVFEGDLEFNLCWTLVCPAAYVAMYSPARAQDAFRSAMLLACAICVLCLGVVWSASENGAPWLSPRIAPALAFLIPLTARLLHRAHTRHQHRRLARCRAAHVCPDCGYDLRATPHRCPECGTQSAPLN
jgi:hypothetical protein